MDEPTLIEKGPVMFYGDQYSLPLSPSSVKAGQPVPAAVESGRYSAQHVVSQRKLDSPASRTVFHLLPFALPRDEM